MKKFALLGHNIDYSLSPKIHGMVFEYLGIKAEYSLLSIAPENLEKEKHKFLSLDGFNVTKPHKQSIIPFLDEVDNNCFGAVNTVVKHPFTTKGYNTDYLGFYECLATVHKECNFNKYDIKDKTNALVLGAGGVARVVINALKGYANVFIHNIIEKDAIDLAKEFNATAVCDKSGPYDIVINCTSFGLNEGENIADGVDFSKTKYAFDAIYFDTEFIKAANKKEVPFVENGLSMLVYQAIGANMKFFPEHEKKLKEDMRKLAPKIIQEIKKDIKQS